MIAPGDTAAVPKRVLHLGRLFAQATTLSNPPIIATGLSSIANSIACSSGRVNLVRSRIVGDVVGRCLLGRPFAQIARMHTGGLGEFLTGHAAFFCA